MYIVGEQSSTKASTGSKKKQEVQRSGSNVFSMFSQKQVAEFKEGFQLMDRDKDGILSKNDLRATFDELGRIAPEKELDEMINDAPGPINFTMLLTMFAERQSGGNYLPPPLAHYFPNEYPSGSEMNGTIQVY